MHYILYAFLTIIIIIVVLLLRLLLLLLLLLLLIIIIIIIITIIIIVVIFYLQLKQSAIIGEASSGLLSFSLSYVFDVSSFATKKETLVPATQAMIGNDKGPTLERVCGCQSTERTWRGRTRGGGDKGSFVLHWFFYNEFEDAQEQAPTQVPNHVEPTCTQTVAA